MTDFEVEIHARAVRMWLLLVAALVLALVLVGGATRLTESGLSIVEWRPVMGVLPPLSPDAWQAEFEKYQTIPQYLQNLGMTLGEFKSIFWWEWTHRLLGRLVGIAYLLPFVWFLWRGWISPALRPRLWLIFGLGALQGAVGWWMVASGLTERVEVSQYRLATHLLLACLIYVALLWTAQRPAHRAIELPARLRVTALAVLVLVLMQIYLGAIVAGLRAGLVYNTWPPIDGGLVPDAGRLLFEAPWWRNFFENPLTAQFDHRVVAYVLFIVVTLHAVDVVRSSGWTVAMGALGILLATTAQVMLGVATLLYQAPIDLALLHQATALIVLTLATVHAAQFLPRSSRSRPPKAATLESAQFW
jgi:cytochrome c oxidase assembly protein subunit 15